MQALLKPLLELAEKRSSGSSDADRLCEFPEDSYDVRT